jgi:hypothetical protein
VCPVDLFHRLWVASHTQVVRLVGSSYDGCCKFLEQIDCFDLKHSLHRDFDLKHSRYLEWTLQEIPTEQHFQQTAFHTIEGWILDLQEMRYFGLEKAHLLEQKGTGMENVHEKMLVLKLWNSYLLLLLRPDLCDDC